MVSDLKISYRTRYRKCLCCLYKYFLRKFLQSGLLLSGLLTKCHRNKVEKCKGVSPFQQQNHSSNPCLMLLCPSAQWGFGVSNVIFPPTWKAEEHRRKQFMSCESSWTDLLCPCPGCLTHLPAHTTTLHLAPASAPPLHTEISKKQQPVLLYSCQTVNSSTNTGQKNTHYFILPSETHKMNFLSKKNELS